MVLPQDTRAPHRQQRWIELENVGDTDIPAFGVVEIVESYRPERLNLVPGDGPTVVKVKRPTMDSLSHFYVNGPLEIPIGKRGPVGTNDFPCMVGYDRQSDTPATGQAWGTVKDSYLIGRGRQGVAIVGDADTIHNIVRINRAERLLRVTPVQDTLWPGETVECTVLRWDGTNWIATATTIQVSDPLFRTCALPGEEFWCEAYGNEFQTVSEFGLRRRGYALQIIQPNSTGLVSFSSITPPIQPSCTGNRLSLPVDACYRVTNGGAIGVQDQLFVHYHPEFRRWFILPNGSSLIRFEMKKKLEFGVVSEAIEIGTGPAFLQVGAEFPIKDPWREYGQWRYDPKSPPPQRGYMGWCIIPANPELKNGVPVREIVWMEQIARSIEFVLVSEMAGGQARCLVTNYYLGKDPAQTDLFDPGGTTSWGGLFVFDTQGNYPRALLGAKGKARYNDRNHRYEIVECNQMAMLIKATVSDLCPDQASAGVSDYAPMTFPPYGQRPTTVTTANNPMNFSHEGDARDILVWDETLQRWDILAAVHATQYVVTTVALAQANCAFTHSYVRQKQSVMTCGELLSGNDQIAMTEYNVVTGVAVVHEQGSGGAGSLGPTEGTCNFNVSKKSVCGFPGATPDSTTSIQMKPMLAMQNIFVDGLCIKGDVIIGYVFCSDAADEVTHFCGTDCNTASGS